MGIGRYVTALALCAGVTAPRVAAAPPPTPVPRPAAAQRPVARRPAARPAPAVAVSVPEVVFGRPERRGGTTTFPVWVAPNASDAVATAPGCGPVPLPSGAVTRLACPSGTASLVVTTSNGTYRVR